MTVKKSLIHAVFNCMECQASWDNFLTAQKNAQAHADRTGHKIDGETGHSVILTPKGLEE